MTYPSKSVSQTSWKVTSSWLKQSACKSKLCCQQQRPKLTSLAGFAMSLKAGTPILYATGAADLEEQEVVVIDYLRRLGGRVWLCRLKKTQSCFGGSPKQKKARGPVQRPRQIIVNGARNLPQCRGHAGLLELLACWNRSLLLAAWLSVFICSGRNGLLFGICTKGQGLAQERIISSTQGQRIASCHKTISYKAQYQC
jgi:hypothetical protein